MNKAIKKAYVLSTYVFLCAKGGNKMTISLIGGDNRNIALSKILKENGYNVKMYGFENNTESTLEGLFDANKIILGIPFSRDNETLLASNRISIEYFCSLIKPNQTIYGGVFNDSFLAKIYSKDAKCIDFMKDEGFTILNVIPTVEGALSLAINNTDITIHNSKVLVIGYGRIGKLLSHELKSMGARVYVSARKDSDFAWINVFGYNKQRYDNLIDEICKYDIIFNTVPTLILDKTLLDNINKNCLIIDLASKPGGVDFDYTKEKGINVIWALGLPGKVASKTAAEYMYNVVIES